MTELHALIDRIETLLTRIEYYIPQPPPAVDWQHTVACRWCKPQQQRGYFQAIDHLHPIRLHDLQGIDTQKQHLDRNTRQFLNRQPANNVLLWGARGTGKSSLIKALLNEYAALGLRLIEVEKHDLIDLPTIVDSLYHQPQQFIIFCDDLSFEHDDARYKALKSALEGSISAPPANVLIYATSNRRHLVPEYLRENLETQYVDGEIHYGDAVEEKISLSERFGLWLSFYAFKQEDYLAIVHYWLQQLDVDAVDSQVIRTAAVQWALTRGCRSGRAAWQFAQDWVGRQRIIP